MANRGTPRVHIPNLLIDGVAASTAVPADTDAAFENFWTQGVDTRGGIIGPADQKNALIPLFTRYEYAEFSFRVTINSGDPTGGSINLWGRTPEGQNVLLGTTALTAGDQFAPIEILIDPGVTYAVQLAGATGTFNIDVDVFVRAYHKDE